MFNDIININIIYFSEKSLSFAISKNSFRISIKLATIQIMLLEIQIKKEIHELITKQNDYLTTIHRK